MPGGDGFERGLLTGVGVHAVHLGRFNDATRAQALARSSTVRVEVETVTPGGGAGGEVATAGMLSLPPPPQAERKTSAMISVNHAGFLISHTSLALNSRPGQGCRTVAYDSE